MLMEKYERNISIYVNKQTTQIKHVPLFKCSHYYMFHGFVHSFLVKQRCKVVYLGYLDECI